LEDARGATARRGARLRDQRASVFGLTLRDRAALACVLGLLAIACAPTEGASCSVGDEPYEVRGPPSALYCSGPPGCDGTQELRWTESPEAAGDADYCGCDGVTYRSAAALNVPNRPWRWYGGCEQPCFEVFSVGADLNGEGHWLKIGGGHFVAPVCTRCEESGPIMADGTCWNADGVQLPYDCCDCLGQGTRDEDGECRGPEGHFVTESCCTYCEESLPIDAEGRCRNAEGEELSVECCDCVGEGVRDENGFCHGPLGTVVAPSCCD